ncbi:hypothetical protein HFN89_06060 [Rhizobium laguerreae]|nr:hypothetical protein [Rhizobium laguerreae]
MIEGWKYPKWDEHEAGAWFLMHDLTIVGEAYTLDDGGFKWHCKLSDTRDTAANSIEQAKAECLASFWKEQWRKLAENASSASSVPKKPLDELAPRTTDLEQMCRDHFNEPVLLGFDVGRLVGYAEDGHDCYLIINYPNPAKTIYHTCVGGYHWLDRLRGQHLVISRDGERWDDYYRVDSTLELNGAPKVESFIVKRL